MPDETPAKPFNLMLRRPGGSKVFLSPGYDDPDEWLRRDFYEGSDERADKDTEWSLSLPHQCGEWGIWDGPREDVLAAALRFRDELDQAIGALAAEEPLPTGPAFYVKVTARTGRSEPEPTAPWPPEGTAGVQTYIGDPPRLMEGTHDG